jgi:REP element-mobilizing transposase RayT
MAHSYSSNIVHVTFSTKDRRPTIGAEWQENLWAYFIGIARNHSIPMLSVGGIPTHVHLLFALPATLTLADAISKLKANSSRWAGEQGIDFAWQEGYGAFSVSASQIAVVKQYIRNQPEHHRKRSFEQEFTALLEKYGIPYDRELIFA